MPIYDSDDETFPAAYRAAQQAQATELKPPAEKAGLEFLAYLAPRDAVWVLNAIERGIFLSPYEMVAVAVRQFIDMSRHPDLQQALLGRILQEAMDDPRPGLSVEEVFAQLEKRIEARQHHQPAHWKKVGQEHLPTDPG